MERVGRRRLSGCSDQLTGNRAGDKEAKGFYFYFDCFKMASGVIVSVETLKRKGEKMYVCS